MTILVQEDCGGVYDVFSGSPCDVLNWLAGYCQASQILYVHVGPPDNEDPEFYHDNYDLIFTFGKKVGL